MNKKAKVIAIDGPSGSGKSTIAKNISKELGLTYLDTGAMFRAIGVVLNRNSLEDETKITKFLNSIDFEYDTKEKVEVSINKEDLSAKIREHEVSQLASHYSRFASVRSYLASLQKKIAGLKPSVLEGRDIGTVIFPDAALKIFLTADASVRAQRRLDQLIQKDPINKKKYSLDTILKDIKDRDLKDSSRDTAPLVKAADAIEIDTSNLNINEVQNMIVEYYQQREELFK